MPSGIKLAPLLTMLKVDTEQFKKDMKEAAKLGKEEADKVEKSLSGLTKAGEKLSKVGSTLTKTVTTPIIGLGTATTKMAIDFDSSFAKVSTLLEEGVVDFDDYKDALIDGSNDTKIAVDEYSESVYEAISAGVDQRKAIEFTTEAIKLAKGGFTSGASAVDILTTAINGYNLRAEDATKLSDMLITTQNLGKTTVDELSQSMGKVIPIASSVNFGMNELSASYAQLTKNGIATAEAGTYLKQMLSELGKTGSVSDKALRELTGKGFAELKKEGVSTSKILGILSEFAEASDKTLKDMFGSVEAGSAALVLTKGKGQEYNEMLRAMNQSAGATQAAFDKMDATPAEKLKGALNELRNSGIQFGASFVPIITKVADVLSDAADVFSNMSEEERENVIQMLAVTAAAGPMLQVLGGGITAYTKLSTVMAGANKVIGTAKGVGLLGTMTNLTAICGPLVLGASAVGTSIYAIHESGQLMNRTVVESSEEMSGMERVLAKLQGVEVKTREELESLGFVHKEFSEDISKEFQRAVEKSTEELQEMSVFLREIGFDDIITEQESDEFDKQITKMCDNAIETIQSKKEESQQALKDLFIADDNIIDEGEQRVLEILSESSDKQIAEIQTLKDEIIAIKQNAVDEGRALNEQEIADIEAKNARIKQIELEALGGTQEEIMYAKNEFNARVSTMDVESASELLQEKAQIRDEEIVQIQAMYDTEIELLKSKLSECTEEEKVALEEQIENLEKDRDEKIDIQKELYDEYMDIIKDKNSDMLDTINKYNGKVLTNADLHSQKMLNNCKKRYSGLNQITESGCYELWDTNNRTYTQVAVKVDESTGEIIGFHDKMSNMTAGYCEEMAESARQMANSQDASFKKIVSAESLYVDYTTNSVCTANGVAIASLDSLKTHTDGTRQGIINLNGTPYNIKVNKDGTIQALTEIGNFADYTARERTMIINATYSNPETSGWTNAVGGGWGHFNGIDSVPYDGYQAVLHKGERVLTADENKEYSHASDVDYGTIQKIVRNEISSIVIQLNQREFGRAVRKEVRT